MSQGDPPSGFETLLAGQIRTAGFQDAIAKGDPIIRYGCDLSSRSSEPRVA
jgi:hypothetical protein